MLLTACLLLGDTNFPLFAVLGRFLHSLNKYCLDTHGFNFDICDYSDYNFHKVRQLTL